MKWEGGERSENVENRGGMSGGKLALGGGGAIIVILGLLFGVDLRGLVGGGGVGGGGGPAEKVDPKYQHFAEVILRSTEKVWAEQFADRNNGYRARGYQEPKFVLFLGQVETGCGVAPSTVGPFYCPADRKLYLDPNFFAELEQTLGGSKAEFSQAFVIAHEVGHHVQNLLGYSDKVDEVRQSRDKVAGNEASVRLELMADYLAGVWAHHARRQSRDFIEPGDFEEAIKSAQAIGDDKIARKSGRSARPENFTHGTARQRARYFSEGFQTGDARKQRLDRFFQMAYRNGELQE